MHSRTKMTSRKISNILAVLLITLLTYQSGKAQGQQILEKKVNFSCEKCAIKAILANIEKAGGFTFSYNSNIIPGDSLVSIKAEGASVGSLMQTLFYDKYQYTETKNFLVITMRPKPLKIVTTDITTDQQSYSISGLVVDEASGERLMNVSVYDKQTLQATLTDVHGYFKLKVRTADSKPLTITASKVTYADATLNFLKALAVSDKQYDDRNNTVQNNRGIEKDGIGRFMIGARQKIQSLNIQDFFAKRPFQISLTPGFSTQGLMSTQVFNKFSLNLVGGYTAGVKGMELGGLFNINRSSTKYFQFAGAFNMVGGTVTGLQIAGISNKTMDDLNGVQIAGFLNKTEATVSGLQLAALKNETEVLKGVQIGLINSADSSRGASIGLLNFIGNGFYRISVSATDLINTNLSFSTGTHDFYTTIHAGTDVGTANKKYAFGLSVGHDFMFDKSLYLSAIGDFQLYGTNSFRENWKQLKLLLNYQFTKNISIYAGPTLRRYKIMTLSNAPYADPSGEYHAFDYEHRNRFGWEAGLAFNSAFKRPKKSAGRSENWYLGLAGNVGYEASSGRIITGGSLFMLREFNERFAATLSAGFTNQIGSKDYYDSNAYEGYRRTFQAIPIKAGIRTYASKHLFFSGELGYLAGLNNPNYLIYYDNGYLIREYCAGTPQALIAALGMGYVFAGGFEAGLNYDACLGQSINSISFSLGYKFKLGK